MQNNDFLSQEYTIDTPENVTFGYEVVGIGSRFVAALIDTVILITVLVLFGVVAIVCFALLTASSVSIDSFISESSVEWFGGILAAIYTLINFFILFGYYVIFELLWNGQTPGKRVAKIRVVRTDGNPIGFLQSSIRNLVRFVDLMPTAYGFGLITMFFNKNSRRLGDFAAGTIVIRDKMEVGLDDLAGGNITQSSVSSSTSQLAPQTNTPFGYGDKSKPSSLGEAAQISNTQISNAMMAPAPEHDPYLTQFPNAHVLSTSDYELMADTLARYKAQKLEYEMVTRLATAMAKKLGVELTEGYYTSKSTVEFLEDATEAYRHLN